MKKLKKGIFRNFCRTILVNFGLNILYLSLSDHTRNLQWLILLAIPSTLVLLNLVPGSPLDNLIGKWETRLPDRSVPIISILAFILQASSFWPSMLLAATGVLIIIIQQKVFRGPILDPAYPVILITLSALTLLMNLGLIFSLISQLLAGRKFRQHTSAGSR